MAENVERVVAKELRDRNDSELVSLLSAKQEELHKARFKHALQQLRETHTLRSLGLDIARLKTVIAKRKSDAEASK